MKDQDRNALLESAAKTLAWELYACAGYGRTRASISVNAFHRELLASVRRWRAIHRNLTKPKGAPK